MLSLIVPGQELFNEATNEFFQTKDQLLVLEHSLISVSKWEMKWRIPFLSDEKMTPEQELDYFRCMTINQNVPPETYDRLSVANIKAINEYINSPMTATWFSDKESKKGKRSSQKTTSELIYYWMIASGIPFECEKWHLNRLLTLIRICSIKNQDPKKRSKETMSQRAALNEARKKKFHTRG